jgi:GH24 family phage-related lysozyme (muramidase)
MALEWLKKVLEPMKPQDITVPLRPGEVYVRTPEIIAGLKRAALLEQYLKDGRKHEGFREYAYPDPLSELGRRYKHLKWGFVPARELLNLIGEPESKGRPWTVGYGYTHGVTPDHKFTREMAEHKLKEVILASIGDAKALVPNFETQPDAIKTVLVSMAYNMGYSTLKQFKNTLRHCILKNYPAMAAGMEASLWYRQTGSRAKELVKRVRTLTIE